MQMTAPQPSSNALPMTLAFVPGGPEPMTNGLGSFRPSTVVLRSAMVSLFGGANNEMRFYYNPDEQAMPVHLGDRQL